MTTAAAAGGTASAPGSLPPPGSPGRAGSSWTPFQEFNKAFSPDYPNGTIILTPEFLNALRDGEPVTLTFHFYGGATVTYHVTKSGSSVTGTLS